MNVATIAEDENGPTHTWVRRIAAETRCTVVAGVVRRSPSGRGHNVAYCVGPNGHPVADFAKVHPFRFAGEHDYYDGGGDVKTFAWEGLTVCPIVCYDLRFPELFRLGVDRGANLFVVIANWPTPRVDHWSLLLRARAIENQAFVVGVNRVGDDPFVRYPGRSAVIDFLGRTLVEMGPRSGVATAQLDQDGLSAYRAKFPALADRRILIHPPGDPS